MLALHSALRIGLGTAIRLMLNVFRTITLILALELAQIKPNSEMGGSKGLDTWAVPG